MLNCQCYQQYFKHSLCLRKWQRRCPLLRW